MYRVYVLKSLKNNKRYIGYTHKLLNQRLYEHNHGANKWTRENGPFKIIYSEQCSTKTEALRRERFLKSGAGRKWLDDRKIN